MNRKNTVLLAFSLLKFSANSPGQDNFCKEHNSDFNIGSAIC